MTLATLNDVLKPAEKNCSAIAGLVVLGWEDAIAFTEAAEEVGCPVILQAGPGCRRHPPLSVLGKMFTYLAERASVPVVCHLDHAHTFEECSEAIDCGFTSLMIDGSMLPLDDNIALTARVKGLAKPHKLSVEGEIGAVGYAGGAASAMTDPEEAARFERETGIDALAISIGNVHLQTEHAAMIDWTRLADIQSLTRQRPPRLSCNPSRRVRPAQDFERTDRADEKHRHGNHAQSTGMSGPRSLVPCALTVCNGLHSLRSIISVAWPFRIA